MPLHKEYSVSRFVGVAAAIGAATGLLLCAVAFWPPWSFALSGDRYVGALTILIFASYPLYLILGDVATEIPSLSVGSIHLVRCLVVVVNLSSLAAIVGAAAGFFKQTSPVRGEKSGG